jgi:hypothetical protein
VAACRISRHGAPRPPAGDFDQTIPDAYCGARFKPGATDLPAGRGGRDAALSQSRDSCYSRPVPTESTGTFSAMTDDCIASLERRLRQLEDIEAIRKLKARYLNACDRQDPEAVRACFVEGEVEIDMSGFGYCRNRDEFVDGIFVPRGCHDHVLDMHHCSNPEIELLDDVSARGLWGLNYRNINTRDNTVTLLSALYHDEYRKIGGSWYVSRSRTEYRSVLTCSYQPGSLEVMTAARSL